ncbi:MAG: bifunctional phosphopantothenoylcysteine decarboxylase/phosphopantothenate--cysteine ligase CoaBC [Muribaculaceae bacterium]|nr:bifunctional phosphopantothenoylcysteine decarboxylase/phosphopantothenate--cysteine ligase CoaBC [Muribaculaceae bacterium]
MTTSPLNGKHIVLGITGGIAAYKSAMLTRLLVKSGAEVQVIMTPNAREFITPVTLSTLSGKPVITEFFSANSGEWHSHVDLGLWADAFVVAPATASTIAKMACGVADNMLVTSYLSTRARVFVAPAMDFDMMQHPSTVRNLQKLRADGCTIIEPAEGELASHLIGKGRMEEPQKIILTLEKAFTAASSLAGKKVLITAGPTYEKIDPVRFIGNYSTGKMGYAIANEAAARGAEVTIVSGPVGHFDLHPGITVINVESAVEMLQHTHKAFENADIAILAAAVADYRPAIRLDHKIKREENGIDCIELVKNPDIAATLGAQKRPGQILVGFALETDNELDNARRKLERKHLDMIVLNSLRDAGAGFGVDTNKVTLVSADNNVTELPVKPKAEVAADILDYISK